MPFTLIKQDITTLAVDAIVNAANTELQMGGGVCGAIFRAAGVTRLQEACEPLAPIATGEAVVTPGFALPAKHVIHAVGPVYKQWSAEHSERLLRAAYTNALTRAVEKECARVAFPLISSGIYGYPPAAALQVATRAIQDFLILHDLHVILAIFDQSSFVVDSQRMGAVAHYIQAHHAASDRATSAPERRVGNRGASFLPLLLRLIARKGMREAEVYRRANLDRKLFAEILTEPGYMPSKRTVIALAVALELPMHEAEHLLACAGYALSRAAVFDLIIEYFLVHRIFDLFAINEVLFTYDQPLLGG